MGIFELVIGILFAGALFALYPHEYAGRRGLHAQQGGCLGNSRIRLWSRWLPENSMLDAI
jgi:hypothetical protein